MITIYTKPDCVACDSAKKFFTKKGVPFTEEPLTKESTAKFVNDGMRAAPIVECHTKSGRTIHASGGSVHLWKYIVEALEEDS